MEDYIQKQHQISKIVAEIIEKIQHISEIEYKHYIPTLISVLMTKEDKIENTDEGFAWTNNDILIMRENDETYYQFVNFLSNLVMTIDLWETSYVAEITKFLVKIRHDKLLHDYMQVRNIIEEFMDKAEEVIV